MYRMILKHASFLLLSLLRSSRDWIFPWNDAHLIQKSEKDLGVVDGQTDNWDGSLQFCLLTYCTYSSVLHCTVVASRRATLHALQATEMQICNKEPSTEKVGTVCVYVKV